MRTPATVLGLSLLACTARPLPTYPLPSTDSDVGRVVIDYTLDGAHGDRWIRSWSRMEGDSLCQQPRNSDRVDLRQEFQELERTSAEHTPNRWHLCFALNEKTHRGWSGFAPAPGTLLPLRCSIGAAPPPDGSDICKEEPLRILNDALYREWARTPPLTDADRIEIAVTLIRHMRRTSQMQDKKYFVSLDGRNLPEPVLASLSTSRSTLLPGSEYVEGRGMALSFHQLLREVDGSISLAYGFHCGPSCAWGGVANLRRSGSSWDVVSMQDVWIS